MTDLLEELDRLAEHWSNHRLEFGWTAWAYYEQEKDDLIVEFGSERSALHELITFIQDREAHYIPARSTVADSIRLARHVTPERYSEISRKSDHCPSFHQLRSCLVTESNGDTAEEKTNEIIDWCIENQWPTIREIREHRDGKDCTTTEQKHLKHFVDAAKLVLKDWMPEDIWWILANSVICQKERE